MVKYGINCLGRCRRVRLKASVKQFSLFSYRAFLRDKQPGLMAQAEHGSLQKVSKKLGQMWGSLCAEDRAVSGAREREREGEREREKERES